MWKAWFEPGSWVEYYPLQETAQWLQWQLWGNETFGYHFTNVVLHLLSALLVWRLLGKFGLPFAWLGGLIFAIHPVVVESVAWIVELKNTLSLPLFLIAMCFYLDYDEHRRWRDYAMALGFFLLAMLAKISMAAFPAVILLFAWWKRGRIGWNDLKAAAPFLVISVSLIATAFFAAGRYHEINALADDNLPLGGFFARLALAGLSTSFYFSRFFFPVGMLPIYPQWSVDPTSPFDYLPGVVLSGVIYVCWRKRTSWGRHALLGLGFFLLNLAPFAGFISISYMKYTWVMDHLLYLPMLGLLGLTVAGLGKNIRATFRPHPSPGHRSARSRSRPACLGKSLLRGGVHRSGHLLELHSGT